MVEHQKANANKLRLSTRDITSLYNLLAAYYGPQGWWPLRTRRIDAGANLSDTLGFNSSGYHPGRKHRPEENEIFEIAAGAVLTQNTNWKNASAALDMLISVGCLTPEKITSISTGELGNLIKSSGYYNQKAVKLKNVAELMVLRNGNGITRKQLLSLWGVGPETADSILLYAYQRPFFVIDAYTRRILSRYTGSEAVVSAGYEVLRAAVEGVFPADIAKLQEYHALFVIHAKKILP